MEGKVKKKRVKNKEPNFSQKWYNRSITKIGETL